MEAVDEILSKLERKIEKKIKSQMTHNECQCVTLDERVNLEAVKYLLTKPKASIISDNFVNFITVIFTVQFTIVLMVLSPLNKVGSMTYITQVDIRVYVYNLINFSLTIVKSFFGHKDMTFYKPSL